MHKFQRGNVFFLILIGIALFGALSFAVSRSSNTKSVSILSDKKTDLAASEILSYAQNVARAVQRVAARDCQATQISFDLPPFDGSSVYNNINAPADFSCHVFHPRGGGARHRIFSAAWSSAAATDIDPVYTGSACIPGIGTGDDASCVGGSPGDSELLLIIPDVQDSICTAINETLDQNTGTVSIEPNLSEFTGAYTDNYASANTTQLNNFYTGVSAACWQQAAADNHVYVVLLAR